MDKSEKLTNSFRGKVDDVAQYIKYLRKYRPKQKDRIAAYQAQASGGIFKNMSFYIPFLDPLHDPDKASLLALVGSIYHQGGSVLYFYEGLNKQRVDCVLASPFTNTAHIRSELEAKVYFGIIADYRFITDSVKKFSKRDINNYDCEKGGKRAELSTPEEWARAIEVTTAMAKMVRYKTKTNSTKYTGLVSGRFGRFGRKSVGGSERHIEVDRYQRENKKERPSENERRNSLKKVNTKTKVDKNISGLISELKNTGSIFKNQKYGRDNDEHCQYNSNESYDTDPIPCENLRESFDAEDKGREKLSRHNNKELSSYYVDEDSLYTYPLTSSTEQMSPFEDTNDL